MGLISRPQPVNLIIGVLTSIPELLTQIDKTLEEYFGTIDLRSDILPFHFTDYYTGEMGRGIQRQFYSFETLIMPDNIATIKVQTNRIEEFIASSKKYFQDHSARSQTLLSSDATLSLPREVETKNTDKTYPSAIEEEASLLCKTIKRPVNIDPGYINESRLILASTKDFSHRIYLRDGIYAEVTLKYRRGRYESFPWTFPDYQSPEYQNFFLETRRLYVKKLKKEERNGNTGFAKK